MWPLLACAIVSLIAIGLAGLAVANSRTGIKGKLVVLEVIVGIAPLIGVIGTVSGLIHLFASLGVNADAAEAKRISVEVSEALRTTIFGLGIAVPSLIAFVYFSKKVEELAS
jgi:biopolymer transport protein ExbB